MHEDIRDVLLSESEIQEKVKELGARLTKDYGGLNPLCICVLKGATVFFADLARAIDLPITIDFMALSSYGSATKSSGVVRVIKDLDQDILDKCF